VFAHVVHFVNEMDSPCLAQAGERKGERLIDERVLLQSDASACVRGSTVRIGLVVVVIDLMQRCRKRLDVDV